MYSGRASARSLTRSITTIVWQEMLACSSDKMELETALRGGCWNGREMRREKAMYYVNTLIECRNVQSALYQIVLISIRMWFDRSRKWCDQMLLQTKYRRTNIKYRWIQFQRNKIEIKLFSTTIYSLTISILLFSIKNWCLCRVWFWLCQF